MAGAFENLLGNVIAGMVKGTGNARDMTRMLSGVASIVSQHSTAGAAVQPQAVNPKQMPPIAIHPVISQHSTAGAASAGATAGTAATTQQANVANAGAVPAGDKVVSLLGRFGKALTGVFGGLGNVGNVLPKVAGLAGMAGIAHALIQSGKGYYTYEGKEPARDLARYNIDLARSFGRMDQAAAEMKAGQGRILAPSEDFANRQAMRADKLEARREAGFQKLWNYTGRNLESWTKTAIEGLVSPLVEIPQKLANSNTPQANELFVASSAVKKWREAHPGQFNEPEELKKRLQAAKDRMNDVEVATGVREPSEASQGHGAAKEGSAFWKSMQIRLHEHVRNNPPKPIVQQPGKP